MDIITTGISATSTKRVKEICELIKKITVSKCSYKLSKLFLQNDFRENVTKHGVKYYNLFEFLNVKIKNGMLEGIELLEQEYREALISLEEDGYINLIGHKKAPTIRFCVE